MDALGGAAWLRRAQQEAVQARRAFSHLISKHNLPPAVVLYALYVSSGVVRDAEAFLLDPKLPVPWSTDDDRRILMEEPLDALIRAKGRAAVLARQAFLHEVCAESLGSLADIEARLR